MKRQVYFALVASAALAQVACGSRAPKPNAEVGGVRGDAVEMWVETGGRRLEVFRAEGRAYLLGEVGAPYEIAIANRSDARVEVVLSVDGRDAVSGREADFRANRGYVLDPGEATRVQGFRTSLEAVAGFEFARKEASYASRMGTPENVGVIGLAVFDEAPTPPEDAPPKLASDRSTPYEPRGGEDAGLAPAAVKSEAAGAAAQPATPGLGTRYGRDVDSEATVVPFARRDPETPAELLVLYYDDRAGLERRGIVLPPPEAPREDRCAGPNPFPGVPCEESGFAPPPP